MIDQPVLRRRVLFVPGYDPNGPEFFQNLFKRQLERYCDRFEFTGDVTPCRHDADGVCSHWDVELSHGDWCGETHYTVLNWDDLVIGYMRGSKATSLLLKVVYDIDAVVTGTIFRMTRLNWRFGLASVYPSLAVFGLLIAGLWAGFTVNSFSQSWGTPVWAAYGVSALTAWAVFALGYFLLSRKHYLHLLLTDGIFSMQHARGKRQDYLERVDQFAQRLLEAVNQSTEDEVLIVGHSSGSFCAVEVVARALRLDPFLAEKGPRVSLLTVGANLPLIGCHPCAKSFREDVALVTMQENLLWLEYQASQNLLNFHRFDPVRDLPGMELESPQMNPVVHSACIRKSLTSKNYLRYRFNCFRMHFQYIMAVDRLVPCDYMMIVAGPASLETRGMAPQLAMEMCHGPDAWHGSQEELQPWLPLPPGRERKVQPASAAQRAAVGKAPESVRTRTSLRKALFSKELILILAFIVGLGAAELPPYAAALPRENPRTSHADSQMDADQLEFSAGAGEAVSPPLQRRSN